MAEPIIVEGPDGQKYEFPAGTPPDEMRAAMAKRYPSEQKPAQKKPYQAYPEGTYAAGVTPGDQGALGDFTSGLDRVVDSFENFNPQPDAGIHSPADAFLFKGVNALTGGGLQRGGNEAFEGTVQEGFGDRAVVAANSFPVGATAGQIAGMGAQLHPAHRALSVAKNVPGIKQVVDAAGKTRLGSYAGRLATGSAAWTGESALQGGTTLAEENSAYTGQAPTLGDRASMAGDMATMNLGDMGIKTPFLKSVPVNVLGPVGTSIARRAGTGIATQGASVTPQNVRQAVQASTGRISGGPEQMRGLAQVIDTELAGGLRPQSIAAVHRILKHSGLSDGDIRTLNAEVSERMKALPGSAASRKTIGQLYVEILEETKPQAAENITAVLRERRLNVRRNDDSAGIIRSGTRELRGSQKDFLDHSARKNLGQDTRIGVKEQVKATQQEIGAEYDRILAAAPTTGAGADTLRALLKADPSKSSVLRRKAKNAGMSVDAYIDAKPYEAGHWMRSRLSKDARSASGREKGDLLDTVDQIDEVLDGFDAYATTKRNWGTEQGVLDARQFGDKLFGGANSSLMNNDGMRAELVQSFQALSPREQQVALVSIRDAALAKMRGGPAGQQARLTSITSDAAIDFFEQVGAKPFADDLLAIRNEQGFLNSFDPNANSRTAPNQQATAQAPALYNSKVANAVDNATPGTILGEGALMAFAPHYQGLYAAYRGSRMLANAGFGTRAKTLEDMTRFLMARPRAANHAAQRNRANAFNQQIPPAGSGGAAPAPPNAFNPTPADEPVQNGLFGARKMEFPDNPGAASASQGRPVNAGLALGGEKARTANREALKKAQALEAQGASPEDVFGETGWYRGYDKKRNWRFEISDENARLKAENLPKGTYRLGDVLEFDELYNAYPDLRNMKIKVKKWRIGSSASYNAVTNTVKTRGSPRMSELIHEVGGHAAQSRNRFGLYARDYTPSSHEVEARALEARARMPAQERSKIPSQHYDVKIENIIPSKAMSEPERIGFLALQRLLGGQTGQGALVGAGIGAAAPADSTEERLRNIGIGAATGAAAGRADRSLRTTRSGVPTMGNGLGNIRRNLQDVSERQFPRSAPRQQQPANAFAGQAETSTSGRIWPILAAGAAGGGGLAAINSMESPEATPQGPVQNAFASRMMQNANTALEDINMRREQGLPKTPNVKPRRTIRRNAEQAAERQIQDSIRAENRRREEYWQWLGEYGQKGDKPLWLKITKKRANELRVTPSDRRKGIRGKRLPYSYETPVSELENAPIEVLINGEWVSVDALTAPSQQRALELQ